ncbi:MAG: hypothetical protein A3K09_05265, partial [Nitrospinae bacterium RIFCSPLOWO2_12_FULL_47_7]
MEINPSLKNQDKPYRSVSSAKKIFIALFIGSLGLNGYLLYFPKDKLAAQQNIPAEIKLAQAESATGQKNPANAARQTAVTQASLPSPVSLNGKEVHFLSLKIENSLNYSVCKSLPGKDCDKMSAYISRELAWFLDIKKSMRNGDVLSMIYEVLPTEDRYKILKLVYTSGYANKTYELNFYKGQNMKYGAYFSEDGMEIAPRIEDKQAPIKNYIEITSLPGEFREGKVHGHSGTDFKADIGTPVFAAFEGKVARVNWNFKMNGDCVEIEHTQTGVKTLYLHLNKVL